MMRMTAFKKSSFLVIVNQGRGFNGANGGNDEFSPFRTFLLYICVYAYYTRSNIMQVTIDIYIYIIPVILKSETLALIDDDENDKFENRSSFLSFLIILIILGVGGQGPAPLSCNVCFRSQLTPQIAVVG
jgi:hypothetical protein